MSDVPTCTMYLRKSGKDCRYPAKFRFARRGGTKIYSDEGFFQEPSVILGYVCGIHLRTALRRHWVVSNLSQ